MDSEDLKHLTSSGKAELSAGLFVTLTLDPRAMSEPFEHASLDAKCLELENKQYLAIVGFPPLKTDDTGSLFEFHLVSQGLSKIFPGLGVNSAMCIPILPETDHPTGRNALTPIGPLPPTNCYVHSHGSTFLLKVLGIENSIKYRTYLSSNDLYRLDEVGAEDNTQSSDVRSKLKPRTDAGTLSQRPLSPFHDTVLPVPTSPSQTLPCKAPISESAYIQASKEFNPYLTLAPASPMHVDSSSSKYSFPMGSSGIQLDIDEKKDDVRQQPFQAAVRVSLNIAQLTGASLPSSTDFLEEVRLVHDSLVKYCHSSSSVPSTPAVENLRSHCIHPCIFPGNIRNSCLIWKAPYDKVEKRALAVIPKSGKVLSSIKEPFSSVCRHLQEFVGGAVCCKVPCEHD